MFAPSIVSRSSIQSNQIYIAAAILLSFFIWIIFKLYYPYPFITIDSYYYIVAAYQNANAGSWPIGYSKFIQLVGFISHSHLLFVTTQYVVLQTSLLIFFITIRKLFNLGNWPSLILYIFLFLNPLFIYGSNHIMSDILFTGLTLLWVSNLLWLLIRPKTYMIFTQAFLLLFIFSIRYTALFFPIFTLLVFLISPQTIWRKTAGIGLTLLLLVTFIQFTRIKMEELSGVRQFSSAAGWKQASNALYMYEHIADKDNNQVPEKFQLLHKLTKTYFQGPHTIVDLYHIDKEFTTGSFYVAAHESPLMQYLRIKRGENADIFDIHNIAPFGPIYNAYGSYLILNHPVPYFKFVMLPNIVAFLQPFAEIYGTPDDLYFIWPNYMGDIAKKWFKISSITIPIERIQIRGNILSPASIVFTLIHITFIISLGIAIIISIYLKNKSIFSLSILMIIFICLVNFIFTISSAASVIRFQFSFIILEFTIALLLMSRIWEIDNKPSVKETY